MLALWFILRLFLFLSCFRLSSALQDYITAYCTHFDLHRHILYGAKVVHLGLLPGNRWCVRFRHASTPGQMSQSASLKTMEADVVVMATGMYYNPYLPSVPVSIRRMVMKKNRREE